MTASGTTLSIYVSVPPGGGNAVARDVLDAEQLAFDQLGTAPIGKFRLRLRRVNGAELSDNARTAIQDTGAVAYLGETAPGASAQTLGITNAQDLLQVSPTDTALALTQSTPAIPNTPNRYYESLKTYGRTFARVAPSTALEVKAQVQEMQALGVSKLYVTGDGSPYGLALVTAMKTAAAPGITIVPSASGADAMFYAGVAEGAAARAFTAAQGASRALKLFGPSALDEPAFAAALGSSRRNVYISSPGFLTKDLTGAGRKFVSAFKSRYGRTPGDEAIFGYAAMQTVIDAVHRAGTAANVRATIVKNFFPVTNQTSVLGTYSINSNGDITSPAPFVFSRLNAGALVPFKSVSGQG